jgi:hypothetical protein
MKKLITILTLAFITNINAQCPFTITGDTVICVGGQTILNAMTTYTVGSASYNWQPGGFNGQSFTASPSVTTTYTLTETVGTCTNVNMITVTVLPGPVINASANPASVCIGGSATLTATGASSYTWTPASTLSAVTGSSVVATPNSTTTYTVSGPSGSCPAVLTLYIGNPQTFSVTGNTQICAGNSTTLMAATSYTNTISYTWQPGGLNSYSVIVTPSATTMYTVTENAGGCISMDTITVFVTSGAAISISASPSTIYAGGSATLTASGASSYTWTPASTLNTNTGSVVVANPCYATTYTVSGTGGSCNGMVTLNVNAASVTYTLSPDVAPHTWDVYPTYYSAVDSALWIWGDGSSTSGLYPSHTYAAAGTYSICVMAYTSCGNTAQVCQTDAVSRLGNNSTTSSMVYVFVLNSQTTGMKKITSNNELNIYPNPNNGSFVVETNTTDKQTIALYDVNGKLVLSQTITGKTNIDASILNEGVYNISIVSNEGVVNKRLVIVK